MEAKNLNQFNNQNYIPLKPYGTQVESQSDHSKSRLQSFFSTLTPRIILQSILLDILLEPILYFSLVDDVGEAIACGISSLPDGISILISAILDQNYETTQIISMVIIFISSILTLTFKKAKLSQIPDSLIPGLIGLNYLLSKDIDRPLFFYATRPWAMKNSNLSKIKLIDDRWDKSTQLKVKEKISKVWGIGLIIQSSIICTLIFYLKLDTLIIVTIAISILISLILNVWALFYAWKWVQWESDQQALLV